MYQNNSLVKLEDVGEDVDALLCVTDQPVCCEPLYTGEMGPAVGNWYFPNGTRVPSETDVTSGLLWDFFRTRGQSLVLMHRRRGGVAGIYRCDIPDIVNVTQTLYIGLFTASTGKCCK